MRKISSGKVMRKVMCLYNFNFNFFLFLGLPGWLSRLDASHNPVEQGEEAKRESN